MAVAEVVNSDRMGSTGYPGELMKLIGKESFSVTLSKTVVWSCLWKTPVQSETTFPSPLCVLVGLVSTNKK